MRRSILAFALLTSFGMSACRFLELKPKEPVTDSLTAVPQAVVNAIRSAYPAATDVRFSEIDKEGKVWESRFQVSTVGHTAMVNEKGTILETYAVKAAAAGMPADTISPAITAYIRTAYPDYTLVASGAGQFNNQKSFKVLLRSQANEVTLIFDEKGALLFEHKASLGNAEPPKTYPVARVDDLPEPVRLYLTSNGYTFARGLVTIGADNLKVYLLVVMKGNVVYELSIDAGGKFPTIRSYISSAPPTGNVVQKSITSAGELPTAITSFLNEQYKGWAFLKGYVNSESDKPVEYMVVVGIGADFWYVSFDGNGKFVASRKGS